MEIMGEPGPLVAAAIVAAMLQLEEDRAIASAVPQTRPTRGRWVLAGLPRRVDSPFAARQNAAGETWSLGAEKPDTED